MRWPQFRSHEPPSGVRERWLSLVQPYLVMRERGAARCTSIDVVVLQRRPREADARGAAGHDQPIHRLAQIALQVVYQPSTLLGVALQPRLLDEGIDLRVAGLVVLTAGA